MKMSLSVSIMFLLSSLLLVGCGSSPEPKAHNPYDSADSQRTRADSTQNELSRETSR